MSSKNAPLSYNPAAIPERVRVGSPGTSINPEAVFKTLQQKLSPKEVIAFHNKHKGNSWIEVSTDALFRVMQFLRDDQDHQFISLQVISAVDYLGKEAVAASGDSAAVQAVPARMEVLYVLYSFAFRTQLLVKVICDRDNAKVPSVCALFRSANWYEREIYDMMGVVFEGHPNHKRILLPPDWVGHPLRKDYIFPEEYNGMKVPL